MSGDQDLLNSVENILGMENPADTETGIAVREFHAPVIFDPDQGEQDLEHDAWDDYVYTRNTLQSLVENGQKALEGALNAAFTSHHPRAYEVAGAIMKQIAETTQHLIKLRKQFRDGNPVKQAPTTPEPALGAGNTFIFNGTTDNMKEMVDSVMGEARKALILEAEVTVVDEDEGSGKNALAG